jgi:DNA repair protein RecO (recombination protein O)
LSIAQGKSLDVVSEAETIHSFRRLKENLALLSKALYLAELVDGFSVEQAPHPPVYRLLLGTMTILDAAVRPRVSSILLRHFELQILVHSGFGPELRSCVECREKLEPGGYLYSSARGGVLCKSCRSTSGDALVPVSLNGMKTLRFMEREPAAAVARLDVPDPVMREVERLLGTYVRYVLEREMKSTTFMNLVAAF